MEVNCRPGGYIFTWLIGYSSLLGPIGGIMIVDYYFIRKQQLNVVELYKEKGKYSFSGGFNSYASLLCCWGFYPMYPAFWYKQSYWVNPQCHPGSFIYIAMPGLWDFL
jgi:cytosine/uracil/thiamine/allantoin permease